MNNKKIYTHTNKNTHEVFYVGIGKSNRPYSNDRSNEWKEEVAKDGYTVQIVEENLSQEQAEQKEIALIKFYGRRCNNTGNLVNISPGAGLTAEVTRAKLSKRMIGNTCGIGSPGMSGKQHSSETKRKMSERMMGKTYSKGLVCSEETKAKLSKANSGKNNSMYGKSLTKEQLMRRIDSFKLTMRRKSISDENYTLLLVDIESKINKTLKISQKELCNNYNIKKGFLNNCTSKIKNNIKKKI